MKINETSHVGGVNPYRKQAGGSLPISDVKKSKKDQVQISTEAMELLDQTRSSEKIAELKKAVASGTYQVDAGKVAEKLWPYIK